MGRLAIPEATLRELERIRSLKVFSMCVGACSFLSAVIWLAEGIFNPSNVIDWIAVGLLPVFGLVLICLGWVKALQEMQFYEAISSVLNGRERTPSSS
jgi:putative Mn2+ efflux pump MntP